MSQRTRDNYFILLGLDFDPPVTDQGRVRAALRARKQEWTRWQDNPGKRNDGLNYLGQAAEIEKVLNDPVLRDKEAADARELKREMLSQFEAELRVIESKGYITPREASAIAVKYKAYGIGRQHVEENAKCPIADEAPAKKDDMDGEILDRVTAKSIQRSLRLLGEATLYTFLGEPPYSSIKKLQAAAEQKRRSAAAQGVKSSQATISQELAGICASLFESIQSKQKYDRYLKVGKYPAVGDLLDEEFARSQFIGPDVLLRIVNFAVEKYGVKILEAEEFIKNYCSAYDIPLDVRGASIACPACQNKSPRGSVICLSCAQPLSGICPSCGEGFEGGCAICPSCGFSISEMAKAIVNVKEAETALIENNWSSAKRMLAYVKKYWPNHPKLDALEKRTASLEERYVKYVDSIDDCIKNKQLYAAREIAAEAEANNMKLPPLMVGQLNSRIADFEKRVESLRGSEDEYDLISILRLSGEISDSIELSRLLASYPPDAPADFEAVVTGRQVELSWGFSASPHTGEYLIVRKQNSPALTAFDGEILYEGLANSFTDKSALPLIPYYYSIFTKRAGTYSKEGTCVTPVPVLITPEIENLRILPVDGGAQLIWNFNPNVREVKIWRKLSGDAPTQPGEGILLQNDRLDGFSDTKLKNDVEYWYYVVASYIVDGKPVDTKGVYDSVVPRKALAPIDELNITPTDSDGVYIVKWNAAQHADILLFCASKPPEFRKGDIISVEELLTQYRKLDLDYKRTDSAQFKLGLSGGLYLFAAAVSGRFATVCEPRYVINVADVENPTCDVIGGGLYLNMKWPVGVTDVAVAYRFDHFPKAPEEPGATTLTCTREQYDFDAAVLFKDPEPNVYYMTIFAAVTTPDGQRAYSRGVHFTLNNRPQQEIFYHFGYKKRRFTDAGTLDVTLSSLDEFILPKSVIVGRIGRMPLSRADGLPLFELEKEMRIAGSVSLQFSTSALPPNIYVRLFLHDDESYDKFRLLPTSAVKIT